MISADLFLLVRVGLLTGVILRVHWPTLQHNA